MEKAYGKKYWMKEFYKGIDLKANRKFKIDQLHILLTILCCIILWFVLVSETELQQVKEDSIKNQNNLSSESAGSEAQMRRHIEKLNNRIKELESVSARSEQDINDYILRRYSKTPKIVAKEIARMILIKSEEHNVPFIAIVAVMEVESQFNPYAISRLTKDPARGLMQVRPGVWGEILGLKNKTELHDIEIGIDAGTRVLRIYLDETKNDMKKALYKYVGGDTKYGEKVYECMGKFVVYRSFVGMD